MADKSLVLTAIGPEQNIDVGLEAFVKDRGWTDTVPNPAAGQPGHVADTPVGQPIPNPVTQLAFAEQSMKDFVNQHIISWGGKVAAALIEQAKADAKAAVAGVTMSLKVV